MSVFNIEYDIPVAGPISVVPFVDAGNLLPNAEDASLDDMHYAAGLGVVLNSPIGPLPGRIRSQSQPIRRRTLGYLARRIRFRILADSSCRIANYLATGSPLRLGFERADTNLSARL